ncbi:divergent polysaccharide deacetylase family protein [Paracoccaceae bacterium Fryx2]|nr:divergent polysaccharide deacetylase family protein [Paracoccaceae bacterium Fryx2]
MRGFVSGMVWGSAVAVLGLGVASQMAPLPGRLPSAPAVQRPEPQAPEAPPVAQAPEAAPVAQAPVVPEAGEPGVAGPPATDAATPSAAVTESMAPPPGSEFARPRPDVAPILPAADPALAEGPAPAVLPPDAVQAPQPDTMAALRPVTPDQSPAGLSVPEAAAAPGRHRVPEPSSDPVRAATDPTRPAAPPAEQTPAAIDLPPPPPLTPEEEALLRTAPDAPPPAPAEQAPSKPAPADPVPAADQTPGPAPAGAVRGDAPLPTPGFGGAIDGVTADRLPRIGTPQPTPAAEPAAAELAPLHRYARPFENPAQKPLFAVILLDTGGPALDRTALAALPFPVTFAIDPAAPDAATAAALYREAGQEVLMLATGIPQGATASDLEVTFQSLAATLPEAVAVLDTEAGAFQSDRPLATQVVPVIKGQGRGLVTWDKGLNAADQVARRDGVPATLIFRRLDGADESAATIRRYLDRAAFKAAQDGRVTVLGETRPETVAALLEWSVEGRGASVALAPISAVLKAD